RAGLAVRGGRVLERRVDGRRFVRCLGAPAVPEGISPLDGDRQVGAPVGAGVGGHLRGVHGSRPFTRFSVLPCGTDRTTAAAASPWGTTRVSASPRTPAVSSPISLAMPVWDPSEVRAEPAARRTSAAPAVLREAAASRAPPPCPKPTSPSVPAT